MNSRPPLARIWHFIPLIFLLLLVAPLIFVPEWHGGDNKAVAQNLPPPAGPGWLQESPPPISPDQARLMVSVQGVEPLATSDQAEQTDEIKDLARALQNNPKWIIDYVYNMIDYTPGYGVINGATVTLYAGRGNDGDQAALLIALLRAAGYTAQFVTGDVTYTPERLANWLGADATVTHNILVNAGVPITGTAGGVQVFRVWAEAYIGGQWYTLDPAIKEYQETSGLSNLGSVLGYDRAALMSRAQQGATVTADYAQAINEANLYADLAAYSGNLVNYLRANMPAANLASVIGWRRIVPIEMTAYPTALPFAQNVANRSARMAQLPASMCHKLSITRADQPGDDRAFYTYQVAARRMTIFYSAAADASVLRLDGAAVVTYTNTPTNTAFTIRLEMDHPLTIRDQYGDFSLRSGRGAYAIVHDWNGTSPQLMAWRNRLRAQAVYRGHTDTSEPALGESLALLGQEWVRQVRMFGHIVDQLNKTRTISHHSLGIVGQQDGFYIDIPLSYSAIASINGSSDIWLSGRVQTMMASAFEHGILKQLQAHDGWDSLSAIRMLQFSNSQNTKTFLARSANWSSIRSQLVDYDADDLNWFDTLIANGYELVLPQDGRQQLDNWQGVGYIQRKQTVNSASMGMIIYGGYAGGYTSKPVKVDPGSDYWNHWQNDPWQIYNPKSKDPVNMFSGSFTVERTDLTIGPQTEPLGLYFARAYDSHNAYQPGPLGYGWTHNYQWTAARHSNGPAGLGDGGAINAASLIAYTHVALDLLTHQLNPQGWTSTAIATKWAMDRLLDNAVTVQANHRTYTFISLADGSYNAPLGGGDVLTVDGSGYHLYDRSGERFEFSPAGQITSWQDANGNTMAFTYDGSSRLIAIADAWSNTLTLTYSGSLLSSVSNAGRTVQFAYTGNQLTAVTDPAGAVWRYAYDADNRMTHVYKPNSTTIARAVNVYDQWGRVKEQTDALGHKTEFLFSGYRNTERFPDGGEVIYLFNRQGLFVGRQDQAGSRTTFSYNGLGQLVSMTDRLTDTSSFTYHPATGRLATITNGRARTTTYTYALRSGSDTVYDLTRIDHPDGAYEQFTYDHKGNLLTWRDAGGGMWTYTWNAHGQTLTVQNPTGGLQTYTYHANGTLASSTDSDTGIGTTTYLYDAHRRLTRINHPDGSSEQLAYDPADRLTQYTDRLGVIYVYVHNADGNLTGLTRAQGLPIAQNETHQYDDMGQHTLATDAAGQQTQFAYNNLGSLRQITYPGGAAWSLGYDARRWINSLTDPAGNTWQASRDSESILNAITTPEGRQVYLSSDALGSLAQVTDAQGKTARLERDAMDRIIQVTDRLNRVTTIGRDAAGRITGITMPVIGQVRYTRNLLGLVTRITDPQGKHWNFAYTPMGRISQLTDPKGNTWSYTYDALGRTATITYPDGVIETRSYDATDHLTRRQFTGGLDLTFTYDALGRLTHTGSTPITLTHDSRNSIVNTQMGGGQWTATYTPRGQVYTVGYDGQMVVTYTYDLRGLLTQVGDSKTGSWVKLYYDKDTLLIKMERSNGVHTEIIRDQNGRISKIKHGDKGEMNFTYDAEDQITKIIESLPLDVASFIQPELVQYSYDDANQINTAGFGYDARGRRTADPLRAYTWDAADRLTRIIEGARTVDLEYTALGEMSRRTVDGVSTDYFYNYAIANHPMMAEKQGGAYKRFYVYTPDGRLLYLVDTPTATPSIHFYHSNHIGSTLFLTDAAGAVTDSYGYTPFGHLVRHNGSSDQPFTFVGEHGVRQEGDSGLYHMRARYYDSRTIQFLSRDPLWPDLEDPKSLNPYQYAGQNPLSLIDPSGLEHLYLTSSGKTITQDYLSNYASPEGSLIAILQQDGSIIWGKAYKRQDTVSVIPFHTRGRAAHIRRYTVSVTAMGQEEPNSTQNNLSLGQRDSSQKPDQIIGHTTQSKSPPRPVLDLEEQRFRAEEARKRASGCCCSSCSLLDTGAARSPLGYLLGPVIGLLLLGLAWLGLRRWVH